MARRTNCANCGERLEWGGWGAFCTDCWRLIGASTVSTILADLVLRWLF